MSMDESQAQRKISGAFLEFAAPVWQQMQSEGRGSSEDLDKVLHLAWMVWNAVVADTVRGNDETITKLKALTEDVGSMPELIDMLALRKRTEFGGDLRLIEHYELIEEGDGGWRLNVQGREP